jgi:hypothetical protein
MSERVFNDIQFHLLYSQTHYERNGKILGAAVLNFPRAHTRGTAAAGLDRPTCFHGIVAPCMH